MVGSVPGRARARRHGARARADAGQGLRATAARDDDGSCVFTILGCSDPAAANYRSDATEAAPCEYKLPGCTDPTAANFDYAAAADEVKPYANLCGVFALGPSILASEKATRGVHAAVRRAAETVAPAFD